MSEGYPLTQILKYPRYPQNTSWDRDSWLLHWYQLKALTYGCKTWLSMKEKKINDDGRRRRWRLRCLEYLSLIMLTIKPPWTTWCVGHRRGRESKVSGGTCCSPYSQLVMSYIAEWCPQEEKRSPSRSPKRWKACIDGRWRLKIVTLGPEDSE